MPREKLHDFIFDWYYFCLTSKRTIYGICKSCQIFYAAIEILLLAYFSEIKAEQAEWLPLQRNVRAHSSSARSLSGETRRCWSTVGPQCLLCLEPLLVSWALPACTALCSISSLPFCYPFCWSWKLADGGTNVSNHVACSSPEVS